MANADTQLIAPSTAPPATASGKPRLLKLLVRAADLFFLKIPSETAPGIRAFLVILLRQLTQPLMLIGLFAALIPGLMSGRPIVAMTVALGSCAIFEELARYTFIRRVADPRIAIIGFTISLILLELVLYWDRSANTTTNLLLRIPSWALHVVAGWAIYWAVTRRIKIKVMIAALIVGHTLFNISTVVILTPGILTAPSQTVSSTHAGSISTVKHP